MATGAQSIADSGSTAPLPWIWQFLKHELAPYPGRAAVVGRMVLAATLVMIVCMTFRLSYAFQAAIFTLLISRESRRATLESSVTLLLFCGLGAAYLLTSAWFVISRPMLHLLWIIGSFFLAFYGLSAMTNYLAAVAFAILIAVGAPLWDRYVSAETNVEDTLRLLLVELLGIAATAAVELAFSRWKPGDEIILPVAERLAALEKWLICYAENGPIDSDTAKNITRLAMVGSSRLRRLLSRSNYPTLYVEQMGAVITLTGRMVDIAANVVSPGAPLSEEARKRIRRLAENIGSIRADLLAEKVPHLPELPRESTVLHAGPFLPEIERTVYLMVEALAGSPSLKVYAPHASSADPPTTLFVRDALSNSKHIRFALKGCLTATLCYVIYQGIDWPGISTSVTTCLLTALSTVGSSRQKQILRFAGAVVGGFVIGMGSQIFILPHVDSIGGFTVLFILVTALSSWFLTSGPRLSYFGLQLALAYYLIHLQEFAIQSSLSIARDRVVGVLFGLIMMWVVFDQLWGAPAVVEMRKALIESLRLLAELAREPVSADLGIATDRYFSLRDTITKTFDSMRAFADGVLLEFGDSRPRNLAWRGRILQWGGELRTIFLTQITLWKYCTQTSGFELPKPMLTPLREFDDQSARLLDGMADRLDGKASAQDHGLEESFNRLEQLEQTYRSEPSQKTLEPQLQTFFFSSRRLKDLLISLDQQIQGNDLLS
jgi:multidrug resistance protein MdtO